MDLPTHDQPPTSIGHDTNITTTKDTTTTLITPNDTNVTDTDTTTTTTTTKDPLDNALAEQQTQDYDSSDLELSSSDEDSSDNEDHARDNDDGDDDDDDEHGGGPSIPRSKNEVTDIAVDTPAVKEITADMQVETIGKIVNVLDKTVVVQQQAGCSTVLDMGSLLVFADDRRVLGEVFETFGPVELPFYSVRFNSVDDIDLERTVKGASIGYVPTYERTQLVQVEQLKLIKGTDASNQYDEEVGADELEFSDDEKEMEYRRKTKKKGKQGQAKQQQQQQRGQKRHLEDVTMPDARRSLQSYADIMTTSSYSIQQHQAPPSTRLPPPPRQQHPDAMTALLDSYVTSQPASRTAQVQPPQPPVPFQLQQQQQQQQQEQPQIQQQPQQPTEQPSPSRSIFQSIRSLFSRAPPPS